MQAYARQTKDTQLIGYATEIRLRAERRFGELWAVAQKNKGTRGQTMAAGPGKGKKGKTGPSRSGRAGLQDDTPTLAELGVSYKQAANWVRFAKLPEIEYEAKVVIIVHRAEASATAAPKPHHRTHGTGENEWYTPPEFIEAARRAMGGIDCDPASSEMANRTVAASAYYDAAQDGLKQDWHGRVWMNPPYAQPLCAQFCAAAAAKFEASEYEQACVLVNNATETAWFQGLLAVAGAVCFLMGRVKYLDRTGTPANTPLQGQAIIYLGANGVAFANEFRCMGTVLFHGQ